MALLVTTRPAETKIINGKWVLGEDFLSKYRGKQPRWGFDGLGWVVYVRTYARTKEDGTLESMHETAERVTLGNFNLIMTEGNFVGQIDPTVTKEEVERFYHLFFNLALTPPGRGWWMSGTAYALTCGDALNNCWYTDVVPQARHIGGKVLHSTPFVFTFDQAMKGGGVGAGIYKENIDQFAVTSNEVKLTFVVNKGNAVIPELKQVGVKFITKEQYTSRMKKKGKNHKKNIRYFTVPDSREGWDESLAKTIDLHFENPSKYASKPIRLYVDLSLIRPRGAKIARFGGTASGSMPLAKGLTQINSIFNRSAQENRRITTVEAGDCIQIIGTVVVAGNVRRTALILIGDEDDVAFIESKDYSKMGLEPSQWRWASNNSIIITCSTPRERLKDAAGSIYFNGEPGIVNIELSRNYGRIIDGLQALIDGRARGTNPCGEVTLEDKEPCNLFEINLVRCRELGVSWEEAAYLATRYAYRVTFMPYEWDRSREVVYENRRTGVAVTGVSDYELLYCDGDYDLLAKDLEELYGHVVMTNKYHAKALGTKESIKKTTVKPSGSQSKVMGVSAGQHDHWGEYFIQRMRIAADAPIMDLIFQSGYPVEYAINGRHNDGTPVYDMNTCVVEFPVKAPTAGHPKFRSSAEVPLMEQAERQALLQTYWADNAVSATLTFKKAEKLPNGTWKNGIRDEDVVDEITEVLTKYQNVFKSTSLLPHQIGTYDQMPWETIDKVEYDRRVAELKGRPWDFMQGGLRAVEDELEQDCVGGACPIR
ncbi:ribonucleoside-triphosphate reductase, adenosylcobalamin-dependent [Brevibacillus laterosporus]|uniref:ribonucleoside-triphosphate reductase, adenosylcobalamin-dependent n=1 Tax=Brevibacillus laterosporus TaxID=1465 RepID=UPI00038186CA|nr:ribonucleoside-triphosphate reductase, adenosylcobalamin-dependent [Brevibacillus laterosporus]ATO48533.1 ribonucleoside-triphosphate reductase, adenosylcobalamin-dependent [Brevibacillus laterosporus DSM 25]MED2002367.1 ribonucleoside-triphosphate reductase, adenosylcobalamin-dependent [Brevibacillus laterosporus]